MLGGSLLLVIFLTIFLLNINTGWLILSQISRGTLWWNNTTKTYLFEWLKCFPLMHCSVFFLSWSQFCKCKPLANCGDNSDLSIYYIWYLRAATPYKPKTYPVLKTVILLRFQKILSMCKLKLKGKKIGIQFFQKWEQSYYEQSVQASIFSKFENFPRWRKKKNQ